MTSPGEMDQRLSIDFVNSVRDGLRKIKDTETAWQVLEEAGVDLEHVSKTNPYLLWGNGVRQAIRQGILKQVIERAIPVAGDGAGGEDPENKNSLTNLLKEYNQEYKRVVIAAVTEDGRDLHNLLVELEQHWDPGHLHGISVKVNQAASRIRQRLDDDEQFKALPLESGTYGGPSLRQQRERLVKRCYRVMEAANRVSRHSRVLSLGENEDEFGDESEDETWGRVAVDEMLQIMREQQAHRGIDEWKKTLAARMRRLLRDLRVTPLESTPEA
jgi:hypothetical protein